MNGNNTLTLCNSAVTEALQTYLNEHVLKVPVVVTCVRSKKDGPCELLEVEIQADVSPVTGRPA